METYPVASWQVFGFEAFYRVLSVNLRVLTLSFALMGFMLHSSLFEFSADSHTKKFKNRRLWSSVLRGHGLDVAHFIYLCSFLYALHPASGSLSPVSIFFSSPTLVKIGVSIVLSLAFPVKDLSTLFAYLSLKANAVDASRVDFMNGLILSYYTFPYWRFFSPHRKLLYAKRELMVQHVDLIIVAVQKMLSEENKDYFVPILPEIIMKLDIFIPLLPYTLEYIDQTAPKLHIILPKLEILAPHIPGMLPFWDRFESKLDIFVEELDVFEPYLNELCPNFEKLLDVLDLLPLAHEYKLLRFLDKQKLLQKLVRMSNMLPSEDAVLQKALLKTSIKFVNAFHERSVEFVHTHESAIKFVLSKMRLLEKQVIQPKSIEN